MLDGVARKSFTMLAAAGLAIGVVGVAVASVARQRSEQRTVLAARRIALIGDSYAVGLGPELAKLLPNFTYTGQVGAPTSRWASWLPGWLTTYQPTLTLVALGVNDGNAPNGANYHAVVSALHGIGSRVVWIEPPAGVSAPLVRAAIESLGVEVVPGANVPLAVDGLHPANYGTWAAIVAKAVG
jgi:hypothetical protein